MRDKEFDGTFILLLLYEKFYFVLLSTFFSFAFLISIEEIFHRIFTLDHSLNFSFNLLQWFTCKTSGFRYVFNFRFFSLSGCSFFFAISTSQDFSIRKIFKKKLLARRAATKTEVTRPVSGYWNSHTTEKYNLFFCERNSELWSNADTTCYSGYCRHWTEGEFSRGKRFASYEVFFSSFRVARSNFIFCAVPQAARESCEHERAEQRERERRGRNWKLSMTKRKMLKYQEKFCFPAADIFVEFPRVSFRR